MERIFENSDLSENVRAEWYTALFEEDCVRVQQLLKDHPNLWKVGWQRDPSRKVEGSPRNHWIPRTRSVWKGRTALHVGAKRGCVELILQVLELCDIRVNDRIATTTSSSTQGREDIVATESQTLAANGATLSVSTPSGENIVASAGQSAERGGAPSSPRLSGENMAAAAGQTPEGGATPIAPIQSGEITELGPAIALPTPTGAAREEWTQGASTHWKMAERNKFEELLGEFHEESSVVELPLWERNLPNRSNFQKLPTDDILLQKARAESENRRCESSTTSVYDTSVLDLLTCKDGEYKLDALAMAILLGNVDLICPLVHAIGRCENHPQHKSRLYVKKCTLLAHKVPEAQERKEKVISNVIEEVVDKFRVSCPHIITWCEREYSRHRDFNFLPWRKYLFHFLFTSRFQNANLGELVNELRKRLWEEVKSVEAVDSWRFLLQLRDGQGRAPLHVAVDEGTTHEFFKILGDGSDDPEKKVAAGIVAMKEVDGAGRTALHRAIATNNYYAVNFFLFYMDRCKEVAGHSAWQHSMPQALGSRINCGLDLGGIDAIVNVDQLSRANGFVGHRSLSLSTPLHTAIIHKHSGIAVRLLNWRDDSKGDDHLSSEWSGKFYVCNLMMSDKTRVELDEMELAILVGDVRVVKLLEDGYLTTSEPNNALQQRKVVKKAEVEETQQLYLLRHPWPIVHLLATWGNYEILKLFTESLHFDPSMEDFEGNSALHHAMKVRHLEFNTHLLHYVNCEHIVSNDPRVVNEEALKDSSLVERQGCINLLLQAGCDIFKANKKKQVPYPQGSLNTHAGFLSWWYTKQAKEFGATKNSLNFASSAISITAALVATASFVGPLQPPLNYEGHIQYKHVWVRVFIFSDTISFYLAIAAITLSLIPSLPMPQVAILDELRRSQKMIRWAVQALFPSLAFIFLAFASSSISVIGSHIKSEHGGQVTLGLTIATFALGGISCLVTFFFFFIRLLAFSRPRNVWVRYF